jgi:predicted phage terminase large subunit-like protein
LCLPHREAFYGGAAGGGKSDALLMAALLFVDVPKYAALILRRTFPDLSLPGAIMDRAGDWLRGTDAVWRDATKTWEFPSGATLTFGYLQTEMDKYHYQGAELQFVGYDEITQFTETQYTYLLSRLRRLSGADVPLRQRAAGNPGGLGHEWVKARFVMGTASAPFIPARLADNPHLDQTAYRQSLAGLDDVTRAQLEDGNWDVQPSGGLFERAWFLPTTAEYTAVTRVRAWDLAASLEGDWTVGVRMARTADNRFIVEHVARFRKLVGDRDEEIVRVAAQDGRQTHIALEEEGGSAGKSQTASLAGKLAGYVVRGERPTGPKDVRARPFASQVQAGNVRYLPGTWDHAAWITELTAFPTGRPDDQVDASSGAFNTLAGHPLVSARGAVGGERTTIKPPPSLAQRPTNPQRPAISPRRF